MAAAEVRRAIVGRIPDSLRNCVNKEYFVSPQSSFPAGFGDSLGQLGQLGPASMLMNNGSTGMGVGGMPGMPGAGTAFPFNQLGVLHGQNPLDQLHLAAAAAAQMGGPPAAHPQPHSTLQDLNNHMKQESSEVH